MLRNREINALELSSTPPDSTNSTSGTSTSMKKKDTSSSSGGVLEPYALQLVIGKTMREELGEEVAIAFCKNIKCGQLVLITGRLGELVGKQAVSQTVSQSLIH